jgi:formylglycine-generating enzyme required for sulfatase activity
LEAGLADLLNAGVRPVVPVVENSIGMRFALIPPGSFLMGSPEVEEGRSSDEGPQHEVEISRPFYLGVHPVTQAQWQMVMGNNPSWFCAAGGGKRKVKGMNTDDFPVERVSWEDVTAFLKKLAALKKEVEAGREYRLPTEAEWEYSCRGGACSSTPFHCGISLSSTQVNFNGDYPYGGADKGPYLGRTSKVGSFRPNAFALFDMHGNDYEWCSDWFAEDYFKVSPPRDPSGPSNGSYRVVRGGSWNSSGQVCRAGCRSGSAPSDRGSYLGFRVAAVLSE